MTDTDPAVELSRANDHLLEAMEHVSEAVVAIEDPTQEAHADALRGQLGQDAARARSIKSAVRDDD